MVKSDVLSLAVTKRCPVFDRDMSWSARRARCVETSGTPSGTGTTAPGAANGASSSTVSAPATASVPSAMSGTCFTPTRNTGELQSTGLMGEGSHDGHVSKCRKNKKTKQQQQQQASGYLLTTSNSFLKSKLIVSLI